MLGTRPVARAMETAIREALQDGSITLDTSGIQRIGVSFFDESLLILSELIAETGDDSLQLIYRKAPLLDSLKHLAPNRGLSVSESPSGDWVISSSR